MADLADSFVNGFVQFQDTFGSGQTNGAMLIQQAAMGRITGSTFKIGFTSLGSEATIKNRVYLEIPKQYWAEGTKLQMLGSDKLGWGGIYFPVTPSIKQDSKANWNASALQHSNYAIYSYVNTDVGAISVSGQFPVQSQQEAYYWVATITALRALTKMRTGNDTVPGAPPPVCRFNAYGSDIYENVPVVIGGFSVDLPADVDYITGFNFNGIENKVPTLSTISLTLLPVYSRAEMSKFGVDSFVKGTLPKRGYL
jgi:hypothetical protein